MAKIMNIVFGIGVAVILYIVVLLGINVFYPSPEWGSYNCTAYPGEFNVLSSCTSDMTVAECKNITTEEQKVQDECNKKFQDDLDIYNKNFLLITNATGMIIIVVALLLFLYLSSMINISVGAAFSGLALIFFGFIVGWQSTNDVIKFILALVIAAVIIAFAVIINKKYNRKRR